LPTNSRFHNALLTGSTIISSDDDDDDDDSNNNNNNNNNNKTAILGTAHTLRKVLM
jgi:hypothetical protein